MTTCGLEILREIEEFRIEVHQANRRVMIWYQAKVGGATSSHNGSESIERTQPDDDAAHGSRSKKCKPPHCSYSIHVVDNFGGFVAGDAGFALTIANSCFMENKC